MGLYDRDYMRAGDWDSRREPAGSTLGFLSRLFGGTGVGLQHPVVVTYALALLVLVCSGVWHLAANNFLRRPSLAEYLVNQQYYDAQWARNLEYVVGMYEHLTLSENGLDGRRHYSLITYPLLHPDLIDLLFRLTGLVAFGICLESYWGARKMAVMVASCVLVGAAVHMAFETSWCQEAVPFLPDWLPAINDLPKTERAASGSSGIVCGMLAAAFVQFPKARLFGLPIPLGLAAVVYATVDLLGVLNFQGAFQPYALIFGGTLCGLTFGTWGRLRCWSACRKTRYRPVRRAIGR